MYEEQHHPTEDQHNDAGPSRTRVQRGPSIRSRAAHCASVAQRAARSVSQADTVKQLNNLRGQSGQ